MAHSYGGTTAIWKRPIRHHQPSEPAALCLLEASKAAGSPGWRSLRSYIMLLFDIHRPLPRVYEYIYAADTRYIHGSATLIRPCISLQVWYNYNQRGCVEVSRCVNSIVHTSHHQFCHMCLLCCVLHIHTASNATCVEPPHREAEPRS